MSRKHFKISNPDVKAVLRDALEDGAMSIADACKAIRAMNHLSQESLANLVGLSLKVIKEVESGKGNPRLSSMQKLAEFADLEVVFAAPKKKVRLGDPQDRAREKQMSRERDFDRSSAGSASNQSINKANALKIEKLRYELPEID